MKLFGRLPEMLLGIIVAIVLIQLVVNSITPYLGWLGITATILIIIVMVLGVVAGVIALIRQWHNRSGRGDTFND